jgi:nucleotide sugar dehydrogenase
MSEQRIAIHGLGYVGLTAAVHWAKAGWQVVGYDPDPSTVARLNDGLPRSGEFLSYINADVAELVDREMLIGTTNFGTALECPVQSIAVPSEREGKPYDEIVIEVLTRLLAESGAGTTILVESTLTPGTIDRVLSLFYDGPYSSSVEQFAQTGLALAVCPRRDWFADKSSHLGVMKRIVGGVTPQCTTRAVRLLANVSQDIEPTTYRIAEITKALENALLHAAVMVPTELAMNMKDRDIADAVSLATTHPRLMHLFLGAGAGGRCIPLGPQYLNMLNGPHEMLTTSLKIDRHIRMATASAVAQRGCKTALVLGMAYRPDFRDMGLSPGLAVAQHLQRDYGIEVTVHDPMWPHFELENLTGMRVTRPDFEPASMAFYDAVVHVTPHSLYKDWPSTYLDPLKDLRFVLDAQGTWQGQSHEFTERGVEYKRIGQAGWLK